MSQKQRLVFFALAFTVLLGVGWTVTGSLRFAVTDFWFVAGLLLLILLSLVDQPHFSRDANIFVNGIAGLISLLAVNPQQRTYLWWLFCGWSLYLVISSYVVMLRRARQLTQEPPVLQVISRLNRTIGRPQAIFSAFFVWGIYTQFGQASAAFRVLMLYWSVFLILDLPVVSKALAGAFVKKPAEEVGIQGIVTRFFSPRIFECRLSPESPTLTPGQALTVHAGDGTLAATASVIDDRVFPGARFLKLAVTSTVTDWPRIAENDTITTVRVHPLAAVESVTDEPVGVVDRGTDIGSLRLAVNPDRDLEKGEVLRVPLEDAEPAFYQIVGARVQDEGFETSHGMQFIAVTAGQLGRWQVERSRFEPVNWVPPAGGLVYKVSRSFELPQRVPATSVLLGSVPNSSFPVHLDLEDAVTHNTAIIGVTGSGKTYLALHLIEALIAKQIRVLILDLSRQHWIFLEEHEPFALRTVDEIDQWIEAENPLAVHQFADADNYPKRTADLVGKLFATLAETVALRPGRNEPARVCVVLEEAHSLIPEWNQVAQRGDEAHVNRTARTILQGRKYGLGCLLVTQRTANVTKTILNQCNTIFALQSFDQTGLDFLKNYMGDEYAHAISTLPNRHAILVGKASSSTRPILFEVTNLSTRWRRDPAPARR